MGIVLTISPHGRLLVPASASEPPFPGDPFCECIREAFAKSQAHGLLHLATRELTSALSPEFGWARDFASRYLTRLCHSPEIAGTSQLHATPVPEPEDLAAMAESARPCADGNISRHPCLLTGGRIWTDWCGRRFGNWGRAFKITCTNSTQLGGRSGAWRFTWPRTNAPLTIRLRFSQLM